MKLNYKFKNKALLDIALTHISYANEKGVQSNQRLEFLGDSILSLIVSEYIYTKFDTLDEGKLTEVRAASVCERSLASIAHEMELGNALKFGKSEAVCRGGDKPSILCDTYEAVLGAIYLDGGIDAAREWVLSNLISTIDSALDMDFRNYKSEIQNYFQKRDKGTEVVAYELVDKKGPDHMPVFTVNAMYRGEVIGRGDGKNRKSAEQAAAKEAYKKFVG